MERAKERVDRAATRKFEEIIEKDAGEKDERAEQEMQSKFMRHSKGVLGSASAARDDGLCL